MMRSDARVVVGRLTLVVVLAIQAGIAGCSYGRPPRNTETIVPTPAAGQLGGHPVFGMPIPITGTTAVLVPLSVMSQKGIFQDDDPYTRGGMESGSGAMYRMSSETAASVSRDWNSSTEVRWHNAIACRVDGGQNAVLDGRGVIGRWQIFGVYNTEEKVWKPGGLVFVAVIADTNNDKALDNLDARVAIVTDAEGRNPRVISPRDAQVRSVVFNSARGSLLMDVVKDTNRDGRFGYDDDPVPYEWKLGSDGPATPLLSDEVVQKATSQLR
ncbi:MAG: hypothetical protein KF745_12445 [Phycisphaeraceae bacterium]|nr:hypothetical protein [Phycisphaeraceae bacterium]